MLVLLYCFYYSEAVDFIFPCQFAILSETNGCGRVAQLARALS